MKDVKWSTFNSTVGFLVSGKVFKRLIFSFWLCYLMDIETLTVYFLISGMWNNRFYPMTSLISTASRSAAQDLLISGDSDGYLRLFR